MDSEEQPDMSFVNLLQGDARIDNSFLGKSQQVRKQHRHPEGQVLSLLIKLFGVWDLNPSETKNDPLSWPWISWNLEPPGIRTEKFHHREITQKFQQTPESIEADQNLKLQIQAKQELFSTHGAGFGRRHRFWLPEMVEYWWQPSLCLRPNPRLALP
ncbi:hypothetical protein FH972_016094 [Carpinus fangiana]|uniref:Uncharacterized protein n=1 Tax=Carpinus fangiana TaxID=176857 RepID=A0A5N6RI80_9ROSI|nr:hypothetical protein FH972_016094 [Carpinus fangiana]